MKIKYTNLFYIALTGWVIGTVVFGESKLVSVLGNLIIYNAVWLACRAMLLVKIFHDIKKHGKIALKISIIAALGVVSWYFSQSVFLTPLFWFLCAGKDVKIEKVIKILLFSYLTAVLSVIMLSLTGVIGMGQSYKAVSRELTYSLGFTHANTLGIRAVELLFLYYCFKQRRITAKNYLFIILYLIAAIFITKSRTSLYTGAVITLLMMMYTRPLSNRKAFQELKAYRRLFRLSRIVIIGIAVALIALAVNPDLINADESLFTGRFAMAAHYFKAYPLSLFGRPLAYNSGNSLLISKTGLTTLDIGYIYLLLSFGIVVFALFIYMESKMIYFYYRQKKYIYILALLGYAIIGIGETAMIRVSYNFTLFFFIDLLWNKTKKKVKQSKGREIKQ